MKRKVSYVQLIKRNRAEILDNKDELDRIETMIDQRRVKAGKKINKK
ncbi:FbpB family small basic protein [Sporolactobacillus sp. THM7-7]|nr:FbpB family small basic protein [Sporolactobacillus sp. THM7-7]